MLDRLREFTDRLRRDDQEEDNEPEVEFKGLRVLAAHMLLLASVDLALDSVRRARARGGPPYPHGSPGPERGGVSAVASLVPALLAPLAAAAHVTHAVRPTAESAAATRVLNVAAVGAGAVGLLDSLVASRRSRSFPSLSPLALASAGVLGFILEREERDAREQRRRLERRAELMERFVPRRRAKVDRIVVHI